MNELMDFVLLVIGLPLAVAAIAAIVWLIGRASSAKTEITELNRRVDHLQIQIAQLTRTTPEPPKTMAERIQPFAAAPPPLPTAPEVPSPAEKPIPPAPAVAEVPPVVTPPPLIPPLPAVEPVAEPMFQNADSETASTPPPMEAPPAPEKSSFEMRLGTFWLVRIGVVMLLTGLAFFANFAYHNVVPRLGPGGKISLLYLASALLLGAGAWWQRRTAKASLKNYAQVVFAGGLAAVYFTTYAAHHIPPLQIIGSALLDGTLLLAWAGIIAWLADRRKSEVMALFAVGLAFFTSVITRVGEFTLWSNLILTVAAVFFLVRNRWATLSFASLVTTYAGYGFWRFLHDDGWRWATPDENLTLGAAFLAAYWLVFTAATFLSRSEKLSGPSRAAFLTLNNGAFFALFLLTMIQVYAGGFWKFSLACGTVLLALALAAKKFLPAEPAAKNAYLTQGLLLVTLGFITKFSGLQLALVLGVESALLFVLGSQRASPVLKFFAFAAALLATGWCVVNQRHFDAHGLWTGAGLGALLAFNAFWAHRTEAGKSAALFRAAPTFFTLLAFAGWLVTTWFNTTAEHLPLVLAAEAVLFTLSIYLLRVREIALLGQLFLVLAQVAWFAHFVDSPPPWWNPLALILITVGLSHWWQHQKALTVGKEFGLACQAIFALAAVGLVLVWLHPLVSPPSWMALTSLLAVVATLYGVVTRAWLLAACGQIFLAVSAGEFLQQQLHEPLEWWFPLAPIAVLAALSFGTVAWFARPPGRDLAARPPLLQTALVYRWLALGMSLVWIWDYVPERQRPGGFMLAAIFVFALAVWRRSREALLAVAVYAVAALGTLWFHDDLKLDAYWVNLLALLAMFVMQQILRRASAAWPLPEKIHGAIILIAGLSLWRLLSCWVTTSGIFLTMSWAGFALAAFAAGMFWRERFLRWFGLGVLAASVGRVVLVDVWKQETIIRVLTFMALGAALLVVGFVYNKYQDALRKWL